MSTPDIPAKRSLFHGYSPFLFEGFLLIGHEEINLKKWVISKDKDTSPSPEILFSIYTNSDITHINDYSEEQMTYLFNKPIKKLKDFDIQGKLCCQFVILPEENNQIEEISSSKVIYAMGYYIHETIDLNSIKYSVPKCLVFLSKYPFFSQFNALVHHLQELVLSDNSSCSLDVYITQLIKTCSSPIATEIHLPYCNSTDVIVFDALTSFPLIDFNLREVLCMIPIQTVIEVYILSFLDVNIILNCNDKQKLFLFIYALECLKYPFGFLFQYQQANLNESDSSEKNIRSTTFSKTPKGKKSDITIGNEQPHNKSFKTSDEGDTISQVFFKYFIDGKSNACKVDSECFIVDLNDPQAKIEERFTKNAEMKKYFKKFKKELSKGKHIGTRLNDLKENLDKEFKNEPPIKGMNVFDWKSKDKDNDKLCKDNEHKQHMNKRIQNIFYNFIIFFFDEATNMLEQSNKKSKVFLDSGSFFVLFKETEHYPIFTNYFKNHKFSTSSISLLEFIKIKAIKELNTGKTDLSSTVYKYTQIVDGLYAMILQTNTKPHELSFTQSLIEWVNYRNEREGQEDKIADDNIRRTDFLFNINYQKCFYHHIYLNNLNKKPVIDIASTLTISYFDIISEIERELYDNKIIIQVNELVSYSFLVILGISIKHFKITNLTFFMNILKEICDQKFYFVTKYLNALFTIYLKLLVEMQHHQKEFTEEEAQEYQNCLSSTLTLQSFLVTKDEISSDHSFILRLLGNNQLEKELENEKAQKREGKPGEGAPLILSLKSECGHPIAEVKLDSIEGKQYCESCKTSKFVFLTISKYNIEEVKIKPYTEMYLSCLSLLEIYLKGGNGNMIMNSVKDIMPNLAFHVSKSIIPEVSLQQRKSYTIEMYYFFELCFNNINNHS